ncbi:MAG: cupin-like domain-containing protein [Candidatus Acidiferrales bacterium]|jgi:hypothetical protein
MADTVKQNVVEIERRDNLPYQEFAQDYLFPHKPVVISGALDKWPAMTKWSPDYFKKKYGAMKLTIDKIDYSMADFIDLVNSSTDENPAPYLRNAIIDRFLPELLADVQPLPSYFSPNWLTGPLSQLLRSRLHDGSQELYIGGKGGKFPFLHFDSYHTHAFISQIYGTKEFTIFTTDQTPFIYVRPNQYNASQIPDLEKPDYEKFPLFAKANAMRFKLEPGETLFVPGGVWHTAKMLSPSISVSVNRANASNWTSLTRDMYRKAPLPMKPVAAVYLTGMRMVRSLRGS